MNAILKMMMKMIIERVDNIMDIIDYHNQCIEKSNLIHALNIDTLPYFNRCFKFYYGCGHWVYIYLNNEILSVEQIANLTKLRDSLELMSETLRMFDPAARIVMQDSEMGGIRVFEMPRKSC